MGKFLDRWLTPICLLLSIFSLVFKEPDKFDQIIVCIWIFICFMEEFRNRLKL